MKWYLFWNFHIKLFPFVINISTPIILFYLAFGDKNYCGHCLDWRISCGVFKGWKLKEGDPIPLQIDYIWKRIML